MKKFQKMIAVGAAFAMAMSMGVSAFAEGEFVADVTHQLTEGVATYSTLNIADYASKITLGEDNTQYTVVLIPAAAENATLTDADILYLNQGENDELFWASMGTKAGTLTAGDYILRVGCEDESIQEAKITVKAYVAPEDPDEPEVPTYTPGDCDGREGVSTNDATTIAKYLVGTATNVGDNALAADCDGRSGISTNDATAIAKYLVGTLGKLEYAQ